MPQSAAGRTIMTTEPKFVPNEAIEITLDETLKLKVRMVDCVDICQGCAGYLENNAQGWFHPWYDTRYHSSRQPESNQKLSTITRLSGFR